ncbi:L,D-transpeptidase family protein [Candidatus Hydrogenedentota bacterium]
MNFEDEEALRRDKRRVRRVACDRGAFVRIPDERRALNGSVKDISKLGLCLRIRSILSIGAQLRIAVFRSRHPHGEKVADLEGTVVWSRSVGDNEEEHGIQFSRPSASPKPVKTEDEATKEAGKVSVRRMTGDVAMAEMFDMMKRRRTHPHSSGEPVSVDIDIVPEEVVHGDAFTGDEPVEPVEVGEPVAKGHPGRIWLLLSVIAVLCMGIFLMWPKGEEEKQFAQQGIVGEEDVRLDPGRYVITTIEAPRAEHPKRSEDIERERTRSGTDSGTGQASSVDELPERLRALAMQNEDDGANPFSKEIMSEERLKAAPAAPLGLLREYSGGSGQSYLKSEVVLSETLARLSVEGELVTTYEERYLPGETALSDDVPESGMAIQVNRKMRRLSLIEDGEVFFSTPVAVGAPSSETPTGRFRMVNKLKNPTWYRGPTMKPVPPADPKNPLGEFWVGLEPFGPGNHVGYGIHGTNDPASVGRNVTKGCVRLAEADASRIFELCPEGTPVIIVD